MSGGFATAFRECRGKQKYTGGSSLCDLIPFCKFAVDAAALVADSARRARPTTVASSGAIGRGGAD